MSTTAIKKKVVLPPENEPLAQAEKDMDALVKKNMKDTWD